LIFLDVVAELMLVPRVNALPAVVRTLAVFLDTVESHKPGAADTFLNMLSTVLQGMERRGEHLTGGRH